MRTTNENNSFFLFLLLLLDIHFSYHSLQKSKEQLMELKKYHQLLILLQVHANTFGLATSGYCTSSHVPP
jgi:hypothetical protein